ncbi:MAG: helix-turn-helix domain-containing protein, partial [Bacteroidota bacterium]
GTIGSRFTSYLNQIRENFGHLELQDQLIEAPTNNIEAYNLYLKGRFHQLKWNADDFFKGAEYYEQSIAQDPRFALPYFGVSLCYWIIASWAFLHYEKAFQKAAQFLSTGWEIDDQSYLGFFTQATLSLWVQWNFREGHYYLSQAIALNPSFTDAEEGLAELYTAIGDFDRAMYHTKNILSINPLSPNHYFTQGNIHYLSRQYAQAIECMDRVLSIDPDWAFAIEIKALCLVLLNDPQRLEEHLAKCTQAENPQACRALLKLMHQNETVLMDLDLARHQMETQARETAPAMLIYWPLYFNLYMGNQEIALNILEQGVQQRIGQFINFRNDPFLKPLWGHPRFEALVKTTFYPAVLPRLEKLQQQALPEAKGLVNESEVATQVAKLTQILEEEKVFLDSKLTLKALALKLAIHPNKLSWLVNEHFGKNFSELINGYRLQHFQLQAQDPVNQHLTLLSLAYDSGFSSKTAFNVFFKKTTGLSPTNWLKRIRTS